MEIKRVYKNARIYNLNGDFEAIYYRMGWGGGQSKAISIKRHCRGSSPNYEVNRERTIQKARAKIRRVVKYFDLDRFLTLTFVENITNVSVADHEFRKFMKRVRRRYPGIKYIAVREFQERGAVHYHMAINQYIEQKKLQDLWNNGFIWIERKIDQDRRMVNYLCKYLTKYSDDERLRGVHLYICSQFLKVPYKDKYFDSSEAMLEYLEEYYGSKVKDKQIAFFQDNNLMWIG